MLRQRFFFPTLLGLAAAVAACGGGGGAGNVVPTPAPTATPHVGPTQVPVGPSPQAVSLSGGGYTLSFTLPVPANGSTTTMSAVLQTTLPSGTVAPQIAKRRAAPRPLDATLSGLVYLVVSTADPIGFASAPSFEYTLPAGTTIASGSSAYILYWDPYVSGSAGWITLLGPGAVSGKTVTFPAIKTGVQFQPDTQYIFALAVSAQTRPTATPAPTPTPTANPSASPSALPAYCANYSTPPPNSGISSPQPVYFTDNSGTGAQVYFYVLEGADASGQTRYLGTDGTLHVFTAGATAPPMPLECFPGSTHNGNGKTFELPAPPTTGYGANLYISYATPQPGDAAPPNPLPFTGVSNSPAPGVGYSGPSLDWNSTSYPNAPFEFIEYQLPSATLDVTQVDKVGLPLQVTQGDVTIGFTSSAAYQNLLNAIEADPTYKNLAVSTVLRNRNVLARIVAPQDAINWGFPQDWWFNSQFNGTYSASGLGYLGYVLQQYESAPRLYTLNGIAGYGSTSNYCVTSDGSSNVYIYSVSAPPCPASFSTSPTYTLNVSKALEGDTKVGNVCQSMLFAMQWGSAAGSSGVLPDQNAFYVWKAMVIDLNRGLALSSSTHPVDGWATNPTVLPPFSDFYPPPYPDNTYARLVHQYMNGNKSYALPYDEPGGYAPTTTSDASVPLQLTVWNIPAYTRAVPTALATPSPSCPP